MKQLQGVAVGEANHRRCHTFLPDAAKGDKPLTGFPFFVAAFCWPGLEAQVHPGGEGETERRFTFGC